MAQVQSQEPDELQIDGEIKSEWYSDEPMKPIDDDHIYKAVKFRGIVYIDPHWHTDAISEALRAHNIRKGSPEWDNLEDSEFDYGYQYGNPGKFRSFGDF